VIVTVTLNPVLQVEYEAERVVLGAANRVRQVRHRAGGRGLAVARFLHRFGHDVVAAGLAGGSAGELIRNDLARAGVATQFTRIAAETRRQLRFAEPGPDRVTTFAEPAPYITTEELGRLATDFRALLDGATAVVLCGSLPDGLPDETYASLISYASGAGVPVLLDASGPALMHGAARGPAVVIPGTAGLAPDERALLDGLAATGTESVVVLASRDVRVLAPGGEWRAELPAAADGPAWRVQPAEWRAGPAQPASFAAEGAAFRDALVAGFVPGIVLHWSWPDILRHALALAASVRPSGEADLVAYELMLPKVAVTGPAAAG
jgi:tagatose 6-phosphate kinase